MEHYVSSMLLDLSPGKLFIDVAASSSPWVNIAPRLYGVRAIALDLKPPSTHLPGSKLAADATKMPFRDHSVDAMALHCAFEMFEGDADSRLIPEAARVLRPGGKMVILPLYMYHFYHANSSPFRDRRQVDYQGAKRVWRTDLRSVRFLRKYDVATLVKRVACHCGPINLSIRYVENEKEVDPHCYLKFVGYFEKS